MSLLNVGIAHYQRGFIAKAIPAFEQAVKQNPQSELANLWLARASQKQGTPADMQRAKQAYQNVLASNPKNLEALTALGELWSWDPATRGEAIGLLKRAYALVPLDGRVCKTLAEALLWQGNAAEALRYAAPIADLYRSDHKWMGEYAQMLAAAGHTDEAVRLYSTVLKDDAGRSVYLRMDQARALYKSGHRADASALFDQIAQFVAGKPVASQPDFMQSMGSLAFDLDRYNDALHWDQSLPSVYQRHKDIQLREARALTKSGRVPEAIEHFNHLYESGLLTLDEKLEFAEYLRVLHLPPEGLPSPNLLEALYQDAVRDGGGSPEIQLRLARYYADSPERFEDAITAYQQALTGGMLSHSDAVKKEFLDFLKSDKSQAVRVEALFKSMLSAAPDDIQTKAAFAEFLSWQKERRVEAMRLYAELDKADPGNAEIWQARIDEVLKWHTPTTALIPMYQEIVNLFPQDKALWMTVARAYRSDPEYYTEAAGTYSMLVQKFPDDGTIKKEWLGLLLSNVSHRSQNISLLKKMVETNPTDPDILATYGKLLSYEHQYALAMEAFEHALRLNETHREALVGKGYVILWSGRKLEAKSYFQVLRTRFPDDVDIAIGLAQAEKSNGRYDQAMHIIQEIKPLMDQTQQKVPESSWLSPEVFPAFEQTLQLVAQWDDGSTAYKRNAVSDFSILPYAEETPVAVSPQTPTSRSSASVARASADQQRRDQGAVDQAFAEQRAMVQQIHDQHRLDQHKIDQAIAEQQGSDQRKFDQHRSDQQTGGQHQFDQHGLDQQVAAQRGSDQQMSDPSAPDFASGKLAGLEPVVSRDDTTPPTAMMATLEQATASAARGNSSHYATLQSQMDTLSTAGETTTASSSGGQAARVSVGESGMNKAYGVYSALDYDTNPLLSGLGRFRNDDLMDLEKGMTNDLRPMIRGGFLYSQQNGNATTTRLSSQGFPNQLSFSLTPQIRLRGGIRPTRYYLPQGKNPSSNLGIEYSVGGTVKYWDRLTLDGDMGITNFRQTDNVNLTYQGQAQYAFSDAVRMKMGMSRLPQFNSLLTVAGQKPNLGFYQGQVLGQARENSFYGELNTNPFNQNWDWNLGYAWAWINGAHIPHNDKNQMFTSLGHSWNLGANHKLRLGYEFLYFGYGKNATSGFFDTTTLGLNVPVAKLDPVTAASSKFVYGGYYSPTFFMMNAGRMDVQGSWFNKLLEYKVGGSLGAQTTAMGHNIHTGNGSRITSAVDGNLIFNMNDWLAAYGDVDFLNAGGQFNRWRFGGGLIIRPHIDALSPVFGRQKMAKAAKASAN